MQKPIYMQIKEQLKQDISNMPADTIIKSERELAKDFHASRMTVRKAVDMLVEEGFLYRNKNLGTFVCSEDIVKKEAIDIILDDVDDNKILYFNIKQADLELCSILKVDTEDTIIRLAKSNVKNDVVTSIDDIYYVRQFVKSTDVNSIKKLLDFSKIVKQGMVKQRFIPICVPAHYANVLKITVGTPIIMVESIVSDNTGRPVAFIRSYNHPVEKVIEIVT